MRRAPSFFRGCGILLVASIVRAGASEAKDDLLPHARVSARVEFADGGAVRLVGAESPPWLAPGETFEVEVRNEGNREFSLVENDRWLAVAVDGKSIALKPDLESTRVSPGDSTKVRLSGKLRRTARLAGLRLKSASLGREVDLEVAFQDVRVDASGPASYDPASLEPGASVSVRLAAWVGPDGRVEKVVDLRGTSGLAVPDDLEQSARTALLQWKFSPARQGTTAVGTTHVQTFTFGNSHAFATVVPGTVSEVSEKVWTIVRGPTTVAVRVPSVGGLILAQPLPSTGNTHAARALSVWCRESPDGNGTSIMMSYSKILAEGTDPEVCGCNRWVDQGREHAKEALHRLLERLEAARSPVVALTREGGGGKDSLDDPNRPALASLLRTTFAPTGSTQDTPPPEAFLSPIPAVSGDVKPPELIRKVPPVYPVAARSARIEGRVVLESVINEEGYVEEIKVVRGHAFLEDAAKSAVCCWRFKPALLKDRPVKVYFTTVVNFTMN